MLKNKKVLVIDDESSVRKSFVLALEDVCKVETAETGEEGIKKSKSRFDIIFCDLKMPGMSGVETVRLLRKNDKKTPIFIVTAFSKEFADGLRKLQVDKIEFQLMSKPMLSEQIVAAVEGVIGGMASYA